MLLLVDEWCSHDTSLSQTLLDIETETPQYQPEAPDLSRQRQTVVFPLQKAMKSQIYASPEKPH